jgi:ATP-dependent protease ClpP protease subunit
VTAKTEAAITSEALKRLIELGVDIDNGAIPLVGMVDDDMYKYIVECITQMSNAQLEYQELTVLLNTYGGETYHAFAIYDLLKHQEMNVRIVCNGPVMSAGTIILMAGDTREMSPLSSLMVHYGWNSQENTQDLEQNKKIVKIMSKIYRENSLADAKTVKEWFNHDTYFTAAQALKIGLIDKVRYYAKKPKRKKRAT